MSEYSQYWETDEFEDLVTRSIIGMHETKIKKTRRAPGCLKFNEDVFKRFRNLGCYFTPNDRIAQFDHDENDKSQFVQTIDMLNDGIPERAALTMNPDGLCDGYLTAIYLERVPKLPKPFKSIIHGKYFRFMQIFFENTYVSGCGNFVVIDKNGNIQSCYLDDWDTDPITGRHRYYKNRPVMENDNGKVSDYHSVWTSATIQFYQDRRHLWNVMAHDGIAKSTFGVYPEQIKSLFYSRDLPETSTGRKRPILHWVNAHQRRMKSGTEVDVEQYLRGTHEFVMNGTKFKITNPLKVAK